jgi:preprotein translocase subunit SecA
MLRKFSKALFGDPVQKEIDEYAAVAAQVNDLESTYEALSNEALRAKTDEFKARLAQGETLDDMLVEAFATVREASKRTIGLRHYDIQLIGGQALHHGKIVEMRTGEGKTLVATLPIYLNALSGKGVHLVTVNDFLARTQARLMAQVYHLLGLQVGVLQMAARTENGRKAFVVDLNKTSSQEDQHQLVLVDRKKAYDADITYGTNAEYGFDYLRDNMTNTLESRVQRGHHYAIIDEVDNVLIDEARTPLIISGRSMESMDDYTTMAQVVRQLNEEDYEISERDRNVTLTEIGEAHVEELLNRSLGDPERPEDITPEQAQLLGFLEQALRAQFLHKRNKDYLVQGGKVIIVDEFTGRLMPGRRWSGGLHQAVEAKEGVQIEPESVTYATITLQNFFRMYEKLAGMTGTAVTEEEEFDNIYKLGVLPLPSNLEYEAGKPDSDLEIAEARDELNYKYTYYRYKSDPEGKAVFFKRKDYPDVIFRTQEAKLRAIIREIIALHAVGRPLLVGTASVENSDLIANLLRADNLRNLCQIWVIRQAWMQQNGVEMVDRIVPELEPFNRPLKEIQPRELREMSRTLDIPNNPAHEDNLPLLMNELGLEMHYRERVVQIIQGGVPNQVLNARIHDQEGMIIARAGAFGAVTIATNMAGRGVDIKLGGELPDYLVKEIIDVIIDTKLLPQVKEVYSLSYDDLASILKSTEPENYRTYKDSVEKFLTWHDRNYKVWELGGLHVIGSERHEARRIDNQLRGRSARQGDPGSSRFFLSMEDDLMRIFGGQQAEAMLSRLRMDANIPIEMGMIGKLVEQSQTRVEGANFDMRKHLLDYDDVLNDQRKRIYEQRDRVFTKSNLTEDVFAMLETDMRERIRHEVSEIKEAWRLLSFLSQIQPTINVGENVYPSFSLKVLLDRIRKALAHNGETYSVLKQELLAIAEDSLKAEADHQQAALAKLVDDIAARYEAQRDERLEALDTFFENLDEREDRQSTAAATLLAELEELLHMKLRLSNSQTQQLITEPDTVREEITAQLDKYLQNVFLRRLTGALNRRLGDVDLAADESGEMDFNAMLASIQQSALDTFNQHAERLLGEDGAIARDIDYAYSKNAEMDFTDHSLIGYLMIMKIGQRMGFEKRTHRRVNQSYTRLRYTYLCAKIVDQFSEQDLTDEILSHLFNAFPAQERIWGGVEWSTFTNAQATITQFDPKRRAALQEHFGEAWFQAHAGMHAGEFDEEEAEQIEAVLGKFLLNEVYRRLLLGAITDEWVDYLTKMEALRVQVMMESYGQRNPLLAYKSQATDLFRTLLSDIRMRVISNMFSARPVRGQAASVERPAVQSSQPVQKSTPPPQKQSSGRRRHKKR